MILLIHWFSLILLFWLNIFSIIVGRYHKGGIKKRCTNLKLGLMIVLSCDVTQILSGTKNALKMHLSSNTKRINQIPITIFWRTNTAKDKYCIYLTLKRYRIQSVLYHWNQIIENQNLEKLRFQSVLRNLNMMAIRL